MKIENGWKCKYTQGMETFLRKGGETYVLLLVRVHITMVLQFMHFNLKTTPNVKKSKSVTLKEHYSSVLNYSPG